jgi:hypothetical protein
MNIYNVSFDVMFNKEEFQKEFEIRLSSDTVTKAIDSFIGQILNQEMREYGVVNISINKGKADDKKPVD